MKKNKSPVSTSGPNYFIFFTGITSTLVIAPNFADPFNAPKMYLLMTLSMFLLGQILFVKSSHQANLKLFSNLMLFFLSALIYAYIFTDQKLIGLTGDSLRQLGLMTYLSFIVVIIYSAKFVGIATYKKVIPLLAIFVYIIIIYGILQEIGKDPFKWINQYDPMILTLGNPNYSGAFLAIFAVLFFGYFFNKSFVLKSRILYLATSLLLAILVYRTSARQGLISLMFGLMIFLILLTLFRRKILGVILGVFFLIVGIFIFSGMMQQGPFAKFVYKESISLRGYYWRAGIEMFRANPFTGVGLDRYGAYFKFYREANYSRTYGYDITSSNAHNAFIQFFATGGLFLGLSYLLIVLFITTRGFRSILKSSGEKQIFLIGLFSAWIVYISQSVVSIDNIGLTVWGWIIGGLIVGLSAENLITNSEGFKVSRSLIQSNPLRLPVTGILIISIAIASILMSRSESRMMYLRQQLNSGVSVSTLSPMISLITNDKFTNPFYKFEIANYLLQANDPNGISILNEVIESDPKTPLYLSSLARAYEAQNQFETALSYRLKLEGLDPYDARNMLQIAKLYKILGQDINAGKYRELIHDFAPNSEISRLAELEIPYN